MSHLKLVILGFATGFLAFLLHFWILGAYDLCDIGLWKFYGYFALYFVFLVLFSKRISDKNPDRVGLNFIVLILAKLGLFSLVFYKLMSELSKLSFNAKFQVLAPFLIFLIFEVLVVSKLLQKTNS